MMGEEERAASVGVTLSLPPSINRTVMMTNSDPGAVTVSPESLTFTPENWDQKQSFNITPVQDADANDENVTLTLSGDELTPSAVTVTIIDDERELALTPSAVTVTEGGTATFAVRLASLPGRDTIVAVSSGNTGAATVNPPSLTFTPMTWDTAQPVTVTGVQDTDTSDEQVTITLSGDGVVTGTVTVDVTDNDTAQVTGVTVDAGDAQLVVNWTAVDNATGYTVQWKSGPGLQHRRPAGHGHFGYDDESHDHGPHQRHGIHGAGDRDPDRRQRQPAVGGGDRSRRRCRPQRASSRCRRRR